MLNNFMINERLFYNTVLMALFFLTACTDSSINESQNNQQTVKPTSYVTSVNLLGLAASDTSTLQEPWNAKDTDLLGMARAIPTQSKVLADSNANIDINNSNVDKAISTSSVTSAAIDTTIDTTIISANAITETITPCTDGGTRTSLVDNQSPPWFSSGDVNTVVYDNCSSGGTTINGSRSSSVDEMIGQQFIDPDWSLKTTLSRNITRTEDLTGNTSSVVGLSSESMVITDSVNFEQVTNGNWVNVRPNNGVEVEDVFSYSISYAWEDVPSGRYQWDFEVQTQSTNPMLGSASTKSLETLIGVNYMPPDSGKLQIIKTIFDSVSVTTVTAIGAGAVVIEVDNNNDGVMDTRVESTWWQVMLDPILYQYF